MTDKRLTSGLSTGDQPRHVTLRDGKVNKSVDLLIHLVKSDSQCNTSKHYLSIHIIVAVTEVLLDSMNNYTEDKLLLISHGQ